MGIKSYTENNQTLWSVYVHVRSSRNRAIRKQLHVRDLKSKAEALAAERKMLKEASEEVARCEGVGLSWQEVIGRWEMAMRSENAYQLSTIQDYIARLHKYTADWLKRPADQLTKGDGRSVLRAIETIGKTRKFQKTVKDTVNVVFKWAIEEGLLRGVNESPMRGLELTAKKEEKVPDILTLEEIRALLKQAKCLEHRWYPIWATALLTGMRNGELHALEWSDVDFENRRITVSKSYNTRTKSVKSTKNGCWRTVPISSELMELLFELKSQADERRHVLPRIGKWDSGLQAEELRTFCRGIGIKPIRFHALRACFATQLLANNVAPAQVMKICGWEQLETMQRYIRMAGIDERGATEVLQVLPTAAVMAEVVNLFEFKAKRWS